MNQAANNSDQSRKIKWPQLFAGLRELKRENLPRETSAGITLAALIIPLNIGYAQVAGLPPMIGLYAGIIPLIVFALFTSSRHVITSPDASIAALVGAVLLGFAAPGDPMRVQFALMLALMCSGLFFIFWFFRLAFLANFLSRAVMVGFITGLGIEVFTNQLRKILGASFEGVLEMEARALQLKDAMATSIETEGYLVEVIALIESIPYANLYSVAIGVGAIIIIRLLKRYTPMVPGALVALILTTAAVAVFSLDKHGVGVLGAIPSGLPSFSLPAVSLADSMRLLPGAVAIVAITLSEGLLLVRKYSSKYEYKADGDQVLFAYGVANMASGLTGSLITGNSPSRSAAMDSAGSQSQFPSLVAAGVVALVLLFFTDVLAYLPQAALAGIVANAVLSLIEIDELKVLWRMRQSEFWIAIACLISVLVLGPLDAVIIAFLLTTVDVIRRASHPGTWVLCEAPDGSHFIPKETDHAPDTSGLVIYRFGAPLYFANAALFLEEVDKLVTQADAPVKWFVLDSEAILDIDTTGAATLRQVLSLLSKHGVTFAMSRPSPRLSQVLKHYHLMALIGENRFYSTNRRAVAAYQQQGKGSPR